MARVAAEAVRRIWREATGCTTADEAASAAQHAEWLACERAGILRAAGFAKGEDTNEGIIERVTRLRADAERWRSYIAIGKGKAYAVEDGIVVGPVQFVEGGDLQVGETNAAAGKWPLVYATNGSGGPVAHTTLPSITPSAPMADHSDCGPVHVVGECVWCDDARRFVEASRKPHETLDPNDEMIPYEDAENGRMEESGEGTRLDGAIEDVKEDDRLREVGWKSEEEFRSLFGPVASVVEDEAEYPRSVRGWIRPAEKVYPFRACQRRHRRGKKGCGRCETCRGR